MAIFNIKMPKLGESITEGTIVSWAVGVGDQVKEDSVLFEVSTAKVSAEIPSPVAGEVVRILAKAGETVPVGNTVAEVLLSGTDEPHLQGDEPDLKVNEPDLKVNEPDLKSSGEKPLAGESRWYSPVVLQLASQAGVAQSELDSISGTGYLGRVSKKDIEDYIRNKTAAEVPVSISRPVTESPVESSAHSSENEVIEMDRVRRIIADRMLLSKKVSPHVTSVMEADVTRLVKWRERTKDAFKQTEGIPLTYMPVIAEAVATALKEFPMVNASVEGYQILLKKRIHLGVAVSLPDGNLIVPVVKDADRLNLNGLARSIDTLAANARNNKLAPDDIQGGTFTITNFGTFKTLIGMPIINQPEVAILGVGYIEKRPAVVETPEGDTLAIRHKMYLSLSYDHRIIDGALAGQFLYRVSSLLENWDNV